MSIKIIDTENYRIFYRKGSSSFLWTTFAYWNHSSEIYWGRTFAERLDLSVLGFVDKRNLWFAGLEETFPVIPEFTKHHDFKIGTGVSMGGYAAIKYSKALGLDRTLAIAPQFSINPETIYDFRYSTFYDNHLHSNMDVSRDDIAGTIYTLSDPYYEPDAAQQRLLTAEAYPVMLNADFMGHYAISCIKEYDIMSASLDAIARDDAVTLRSVVNQGKRAAVERPIGLICASWKNHPRLSKTLLESYASRIPEKLLRESVIEMARELTSKGQRRESIRFMEMFLEIYPDRKDIEFECSQHLNPIDRDKALFYGKKAAAGGDPQFVDWYNSLLAG